MAFYTPLQKNQFFTDAGFIPDRIGGYGWYSTNAATVTKKSDRAWTALTSTDETPLHDPERQSGWYRQKQYFFLFDIVTLERFLEEFSQYSDATQRPKNEHARIVEMLGFRSGGIADQIQERKAIVAKRRALMIDKIRQVAIDGIGFIREGCKFIADASCPEELFCRVFLDISELCTWLVTKSDIAPAWLPLPIREGVKNAMQKIHPNNPLVKTKRPTVIQAQKADMFGVDEKTIRNWESGRTSPPSGYAADADYRTLEALGKLHQAEKANRSRARVLNRVDTRDYDRQDNPPESDDPFEIVAWREEQSREKTGKKPEI